MDLKEYVDSHPLIKWNKIEKKNGIPVGTIRPGDKRPIPTKYIDLIEKEIAGYGYTDNLLVASHQKSIVPTGVYSTGDCSTSIGVGALESVASQSEFEKCKNDPEYFYVTYCLVDGKNPVLFDAQKEHFAKMREYISDERKKVMEHSLTESDSFKEVSTKQQSEGIRSGDNLDETKVYVTKNSVVGEYEGQLFKRAGLEDGTEVIVKQ